MGLPLDSKSSWPDQSAHSRSSLFTPLPWVDTHTGCSFRDTLCRTILLRQMSLLLDLWTSHIYQCKHPLKLSFLMGKMLLPSPPLLSSFTGAAEKACLGWWLITHLSLSLQWLICQPSCDHCHITVQPCHSTVVGPASLYCHFFHLLPQSNLSLHSFAHCTDALGDLRELACKVILFLLIFIFR